MFTLGKSLFLDRSGCDAGPSCSEVSYPGSHGLFVVRAGVGGGGVLREGLGMFCCIPPPLGEVPAVTRSEGIVLRKVIVACLTRACRWAFFCLVIRGCSFHAPPLFSACTVFLIGWWFLFSPPPRSPPGKGPRLWGGVHLRARKPEGDATGEERHENGPGDALQGGHALELPRGLVSPLYETPLLLQGLEWERRRRVTVLRAGVPTEAFVVGDGVGRWIDRGEVPRWAVLSSGGRTRARLPCVWDGFPRLPRLRDARTDVSPPR